jgi:hypothetical protein
MKKVIVFSGMLAAMLCLSVTASAQWSDDFDSYAPGPLTPQSNWVIWPGGNDVDVTNLYAQSGSQSIQLGPLSDVVQQFAQYTGKYTFKAWSYIPSTYTGQGYFIMNDTWDGGTSTFEWCVQCYYNQPDNTFHGWAGSGSDLSFAPYTVDTWNEIQVFYYFDDDWMTVVFNGHICDDPAVADHPTLGPGYTISGGTFGGGSQQVGLEAVDLFSDTGNELYYDTCSFDTMQPWLDIKCNGGDKGVVVPSGTNTKLDFSIVAGIGESFPVDVWLVIQRGGQYFTYDGMGPQYGWNSGLGNAYSTGPFANAFGNCLDAAIPPGNYKAYVAFDVNANGSLNMPVYMSDMVDFTVQ